MKRQIPRPQPVDVRLYAKEIVDLYDVQKLSVMEVARRIRVTLPPTKCIGPHHIAAFLKQTKILRTHSETMKAISDRLSYDANCVGCNEQFKGTRYNNKYCKKCAPTSYAWSLLAGYGLTLDRYREMLKAQGEACALCHRQFAEIKPQKGRSTSAYVDHDHKTKIVRGILCAECNVSLGHIENKPKGWVQAATAYLCNGKATV